MRRDGLEREIRFCNFNGQNLLQWDDTDKWDMEGQWLNIANFSAIRGGGASKENGKPVHQK